MTDRQTRSAVINAMDTQGQALAHAPTRAAYDRAKQEYQAAVSAYLALPEERDAWALEPLVAEAWSTTRPPPARPAAP